MRGLVLRTAFAGAGLFQLVLAVGFIMRMEWATSLWPWTDGRLSYMFCGSILLALAVGALWVAWTERWWAALASLVGIAFMFALMGLYLLALWLSGEVPAALWHGIAFIATAGLAVIILARAKAEPRRRQPLVAIVRWSCLGFALILFVAGVALVARAEHVFPWPLSPQTSMMFGFTFIGLALVYALTATQNDRDAAVVVMAGFLAYDAALLAPLLSHFATVPPSHLASLAVYVTVLVYSAALAVWFVFFEVRQGARSEEAI